MRTEELRITLRKVGRAFVQCLNRLREKPLDEVQEWAKLNATLALEGDGEILEDERLRETHIKLYRVVRPYFAFIRNSRRLIPGDIKPQGKN